MPPTTLASAPSIPATTTTASAAASIGCTAVRRCRPATPTSATISVSAPSIEAVSSASSATPRSEVPAVTMSTMPAAGGVFRRSATHRALGRSTTSTAVPVAAARTASTCSGEVRDTRIGPSFPVRSRSTIARTSSGVLPSA